MRVHCKQCQQAITGSLYLKSKHDRSVTDWFSDAGESVHYDLKLTVPKGAVVKMRKSHYYGDDFPVVCVDRGSLLIPYPKYESGMGCCDVDGEEVHCTCGALLGIMRYDCWQTGNYVNLNGNAVELRNNTLNVMLDAVWYEQQNWYPTKEDLDALANHATKSYEVRLNSQSLSEAATADK